MKKAGFLRTSFTFAGIVLLVAVPGCDSSVPKNIVVKPSTFALYAVEGFDPMPAECRVTVGGGELEWIVSSDQPWLWVYPSSGKATESIAVLADTDNFEPGIYTANLTLRAFEGQGAIRKFPVQVTVFKMDQPLSTGFKEGTGTAWGSGGFTLSQGRLEVGVLEYDVMSLSLNRVVKAGEICLFASLTLNNTTDEEWQLLFDVGGYTALGGQASWMLVNGPVIGKAALSVPAEQSREIRVPISWSPGIDSVQVNAVVYPAYPPIP
ncbi:hypothetical protein [Dehalogenimonas alkenigignens]|uniref:BACON domain-containing protein n=1 Tax=Dehalogenimonas alkenigignens TaxID=1217799 RepID=A0A0W0GI36_9CHLR|nr:hypothetical protein [Dehalogenimonas alkenigignens]KTB48197.1 hypothetical protein DEALK_10420 [Dehalogenimonas alkenigignens]PVV84436.1 hypothetical protein DD509_03850 [Dehalogenimonas alkenigignens]